MLWTTRRAAVGLWTAAHRADPRGHRFGMCTTPVDTTASATRLPVTTTDTDDLPVHHRVSSRPRYRLLGPATVSTDTGPVQVPGARQVLLLALLALSPGRGVEGGRLADALWPKQLPSDPGNALQSLVSRLRRIVGTEAVTFAGASYTLAAAREDVDVCAFEDLVEHARRMLVGGAYASARSATRDALGLWTGDPLALVQDDATVRRTVEHLVELRLEAEVLQRRSEIALGLHDLAVPGLRRLLAEHPLREDVWALLVTALYRSGRTADALAAYRSARRQLVRDLGLEPGPVLRGLEQDILAGAPHLAAPVHPCASHAQLLAGPHLERSTARLPPPAGQLGPPPGWQDFAAPRLFLDRVQLADPEGARPRPDAGQAADIVSLCHLLHGDPLAIELAAASLGRDGLAGLAELVARHRAASASTPESTGQTRLASGRA